MSQTQYNAIKQVKVANASTLQAMPVVDFMIWLSRKPKFMQTAMIKLVSQ